MNLPMKMAALLIPALFSSCDLLRDGRFEVDGWTPGSGYRAAPFDFSLHFSQSPDRASVERSLSVTADGAALRGDVSWDGDTLRFEPSAPLPDYADYRVSLSTEAEARDGLSLDHPFEGRFSTRTGLALPRLLGSDPADEAVLASPRSPLQFSFSTPQSASSLSAGVSISPVVQGTWSLTDGGLCAVFTPIEDWTGSIFRVSFPADLPDAEARGLSAASVFHFLTGESLDRVAPLLLSVRAIDPSLGPRALLSPDPLSDAEVTENVGIEPSWRLELSFSEEVDLSELDQRLSLAGIALERTGAADWASSAVYRLADRPVWGSRALLYLAPGVSDRAGNLTEGEGRFNLVFDGKASRPPVLEGIRFALAPDGGDTASWALGDAFGDFPIEIDRYPLDTAVGTRLELYLSLADGAVPDPFEVMDHLRVEATNGAFTFTPRSVQVASFSWSEPSIRFPLASRVEVCGDFTNAAASGLARFILTSGFADSLGNESPAAQSLTLVK